MREHEPTEITREEVKKLVRDGIAQPKIAAQIGICLNTLLKHYERELLIGEINMIGRTTEAMLRMAEEGNYHAASYILSRRGGEAWLDKDKVKAVDAIKDTLVDIAQRINGKSE